MPFDTPPAIVEQAPEQAYTPLMSEMIKRAAATNRLDDPTPADPNQPDVANYRTKDQPLSSTMLMLLPLLGGASDVISTQKALSMGAKELNPFLPSNRVANGIMLSGSYLGNALLSKYLNEHGHDKIAKALAIAGGIDGAMFGLHNIRLVNQLRDSNKQVK